MPHSFNGTVLGGCLECPNNHIAIKFTFLKDVFDMLADVLFTRLIQFAHLCLSKPQRIIRHPHVNLRDTAAIRIYENSIVFVHLVGGLHI